MVYRLGRNMSINTNIRRSILVQDIRELTSTVFPKLLEIYNELLRKNQITVSVTELYYWMLCELTTEQYAYQIRQHNSKDPSYSKPYDHIKNIWFREKCSLEQLFEFYVKGPAIYVSSHDVDVGIGHNGADIIFTFYSSEADFFSMQKFILQ